MPQVTRSQLEQALSAVDYPADKEGLLAEVARSPAGTDVVKAIRSLPPGVQYRNFDEVIGSVRVDVGSGLGAAQSAERKRDQDTSPVPEHLRPPPETS